MFSASTQRTAGVLALVIAICEIGSYVFLAASGSFLTEPIWRVSSIFADQTRRVQALIENADTSIGVIDPKLGWRLRPGYDREGTTINSQGLRAERDYDDKPPNETLRVAAFGDSFIFGSEVLNRESWSHIGEAAALGLEILNYGVPGYGTDQALMRFEAEGDRFHPHVALMGFVPTDLRRNVNVYRRFMHLEESPATKPRFKIENDGRLISLPPPVRGLADWRTVLTHADTVRSWGAGDYFYERFVYENPLHDWSATVRLTTALAVRIKRRYVDADRIQIGSRFNTASEAFQIQRAILRRFSEHAKAGGQIPVLLLLAEKNDLAMHIRGEASRIDDLAGLANGPEVVLDASAALAMAAAESGIDALFAPGGHYSALGNRIVGVWVAKELMRLSPSSNVDNSAVR